MKGYKFIPEDMIELGYPEHGEWVLGEWKEKDSGLFVANSVLDALCHPDGPRMFEVEAEEVLHGSKTYKFYKRVRLIWEVPIQHVLISFIAHARDILVNQRGIKMQPVDMDIAKFLMVAHRIPFAAKICLAQQCYDIADEDDQKTMREGMEELLKQAKELK